VNVSNPDLKETGLVRAIKQAVLTGKSLNWLRLLSHDSRKCLASFLLCHLQLNTTTEFILSEASHARVVEVSKGEGASQF